MDELVFSEMLLATLSLLLFSASWAQTCPSYEVGYGGTGSQRQPQSSTLYINYRDISPCAGTVYGWHYCSNPTSGDAPFHVQLSMYRKDPDDNYQLVSGSQYQLVVEDSIDSYTCQDRFLNPAEYFSVEQGDSVAACWNDSARVQLYAVSAQRRTVSGGRCSQESIEENELDRRRFRTLLLSAYININECALDMDVCHENATCSDVIGSEDSYNCTCNTGYTGDGFSCIANEVDDSEVHVLPTKNGGSATSATNATDGGSRSNGDNAISEGAVAAIVIVALLILAVLPIAAVLVVLLLYRKKVEIKQAKIQATNYDNQLYAKHDAKISATASLAYEVPKDRGTPQESIYELEPYSKAYPTSELLYEPVTEANIYSTPIIPNKEPSFCELPPEYADIYQKTVASENIYESASPYEAPAQEEGKLYQQISTYHIKVIPRKEIQFISHLGTGQFGSVSKAVWRHGSEQRDVAVKTLTDSANTVKFLQEAAIMAQFKHPNILTLHGVVSAGDPKIIVVELMHNGDLRDHVTNMRPDPGQLVLENVPKQLLNFSKQVALGLHYLSCRGYVHRDLAARNVLVSNKLCKIADFGMSRDLADDDIYVSHGGVIPIRWTAPEAMTKKRYSTASDVWSYGCVLYEIWSLGHKPFNSTQVRQIPQLVKKGYRLPPPPGCPKKIYELMIQTWHPDASSRPQPRDLLMVLVREVDELMEVPAEDIPAGSQAAVLGAHLNAASQLYKHLQNTYM